MSRELEQRIALPQLYGAPAVYRRRNVPLTVERPLDVDDLPIVAAQTDVDRAVAEGKPAPPGWMPPSRVMRDPFEEFAGPAVSNGGTVAGGPTWGAAHRGSSQLSDGGVDSEGWEVVTSEGAPAGAVPAPLARRFRIRSLGARLFGGRSGR